MNKPFVMYTIGHSVLDQESFIDILKSYHINALCDIRSVPFSRKVPEYNEPVLKKVLPQVGIKYIPFGREFGARRTEAEAYTNGQVDFEKTVMTDAFQLGIRRIKTGIDKGFTLVLMCSEKDPLTCHRSILVGKALSDIGIDVEHILYGDIEKMYGTPLLSQDRVIEILLDSFGMDQSQIRIRDEFPDYDPVRMAYKKANDRIGYVKVGD